MNKYFLDFLSKEFLDTVSDEYNNFLLNLSSIQKQKYNLIQNSKLVRYFSMFIDYQENQMDTPKYNLYDIHCEDYNREQKPLLDNLITEKEILKINKLIDLEAKEQSFLKTLSYIKSTHWKPSISGFIHFLKGSEITPHQHDPGCTVFHLLIDDVVNGSLNIWVNNKLTKLSKRGDYIVFDPYDIHSAILVGEESKLFSLGYNKQHLI